MYMYYISPSIPMFTNDNSRKNLRLILCKKNIKERFESKLLFFYKTQLLIVRRILVFQINIVYLRPEYILNLDLNIQKCNIGKYQSQNTLIYC